MTTERLFEFLVLAQTLNYSKAAAKLFITQSTLSRHIQELEEELGVQVLERSTHSVKLTQAGRILVQRSRPLIQKSESVLNRLRAADIKASGSIRIACLDNVAHGQLLVFLSYFTSKFPEIELCADVLYSEDRFAVLDDYDFTFSAFELQNLPPHTAGRVAFRTPGVLLVLAEHRLITKHHIGLEELAGETLFVPYADELFCSYAVNRQLAEKMSAYKINVVKVPSVDSALLMASLGKGVTIIPQYMPQSMVTNVLSIDISTPGCVFDTYLYWNKAPDNPAARLMWDEMDQFIRNAE